MLKGNFLKRIKMKS